MTDLTAARALADAIKRVRDWNETMPPVLRLHGAVKSVLAAAERTAQAEAEVEGLNREWSETLKMLRGQITRRSRRG